MNNSGFSIPLISKTTGLRNAGYAQDTDRVSVASNVLVSDEGVVFSAPGVSTGVILAGVTSVAMAHDRVLAVSNGVLYAIDEGVALAVGDIDGDIVSSVVVDRERRTIICTRDSMYVYFAALNIRSVERVDLSKPTVTVSTAGDKFMVRVAYESPVGGYGELSDPVWVNRGGSISIQNPRGERVHVYTSEGGMMEDLHLYHTMDDTNYVTIGNNYTAPIGLSRPEWYVPVPTFSSGAAFDGRLWVCSNGQLYSTDAFDYLMMSNVPWAECNRVLGATDSFLAYANDVGVFVISPSGDGYTNTLVYRGAVYSAALASAGGQIIISTDRGLQVLDGAGTIKLVNGDITFSDSNFQHTGIISDDGVFTLIGV